LAEAIQLRDIKWQRLGPDWLLTARVFDCKAWALIGKTRLDEVRLHR